jgi:hypothetical protein
MNEVVSINSRRKRALTNKGALAFLREASKDAPLAVSSYADLATRLGWQKPRAWTAVSRWVKAGRATIESGPDGELMSITVAPDRGVLARGQGAGVAKPERQQKRRTGVNKTVGKTVNNGIDKTIDNTPGASINSTAIDSVTTLQNNQTNSNGYANHEISGQGPAAPFEKPVEAPPVSVGNTSVYAEVAERSAPVSTEPHRVEPTPHLPTDGRVVARPKGGGGGPIAPIQVNRRVGVWTLIAALVMAGFSTVLTVMGFAVLLPGWLMLSMGLGAATEFGRLVVVGKATRSWHDLNGLLRCGAVLYIVLAESVSLIGVYSELHNLHTGNRPEATAAVEQDKASTAAKVEYQRGVISDLDTQIGNVDRNSGSLIAADAKRGRVKDGKSLIGASDKQRAPLVEQRKQAAAQLATLQGEAARATGRGAMIDAEVSQVKQVAALLGVDPGDALRWWLLAITILIGPCASLLIAMATHGGRRA